MNPMETITAELDRLSEVEAKANPGPWHSADSRYSGSPDIRNADCWPITTSISGTKAFEDAHAIATTRNSMPRLIEALRKATEALARQSKDRDPHSYGSNEPSNNAMSAQRTLAAIAATLKEGK